MNWSDFQGKKVALLGAGSENLALIPFLLSAGATLSLRDQQNTNATQELIDQKTLEVVTGEAYLQHLDEFDYIFRIAGLPVKTVVLAMASLTKKPIISSPTDLFLALRPCRTIGVTGTKGKGTTSTMIGALLAAAGHDVKVVGNIGRPIFSIYNDLKPNTIAVIELSSFQLEDVRHSPEMAVILPIGQDHLQPLSLNNPNFHPDVESYVRAKANIAAYQDSTNLLVFAADNDSARSIAKASSARRIGVGTSNEDDIQFKDNGDLISGGKVILNLQEVGLRGRHNLLDGTLAVAVALELGVTSEQIATGFRAFKPLPHRLQEISTINEVLYVDDSYATAPDAAIGAITAYDAPVIWIAGGSSKGADFTELAETVAGSSIKQTILIGEEGERLKASLLEAGYAHDIAIVTSMRLAITTARSGVQPGDVVLLSPACASLDMFKSAADRGEQFTQLVQEGEDGSTFQAA